MPRLSARDHGFWRLLLLARWLLIAALLGASAAQGADLGRRGPFPGPAFAPLGPRCRVVPQPQFNLYNDVTWYRPIRVCWSRGVFADTFWPYPWPY